VTLGDIALVALPVSIAANAYFLSRVLTKVDTVHSWIIGTPDQVGITGRIQLLEAAVFDGTAPVHFHRRRDDTKP
jgi:hypothetical protein